MRSLQHSIDNLRSHQQSPARIHPQCFIFASTTAYDLTGRSRRGLILTSPTT
jgi:hypothetical protein